MCGIAGLLHFDAGRAVDPRRLERMSAALQHRGPDGDGTFIDGPLGFAHRRLSILDLSAAGRQPMASPGERFWIVFNGEIYNFVELRERLQGLGHEFHTGTDTEVILHLFQEYGASCVDHLNGMFAFAIWDVQRRELFAARDRLGIKPFYYVISDETFYFASEIKGILRGRDGRAELDEQGLADYLTFQFSLGDKTLFRGVRRLLPGHTLHVRANGALHVRKYWDLEFNVDVHHTEAYFHDRLRALLEDAVRLQLRADVPVGAHLSGGLDSSTIASLAASMLPDPIHTFTGGFTDGPQYDETWYARLVVEATGAVGHEVYPTADDFVRVMPRLMYAMDEPVAGPGLFPQFFVSQEASRHVKVVLGGQGGDEIFAGYTRYLVAYLEECIRGGIEGTQEDHRYVVTFDSILPNLVQLQGYQPMMRQFFREGLFEDPARRYFRLIDRSQELRQFLRTDVGADAGYSPYESYHAEFTDGEVRSYINRMTRFDLRTLLPALLQVEDRTSMAVSLESRVPLLDHRIVELVASMPPMIKYAGGRSKHIFRQVVRDIVPEPIQSRKDKMGFPVPLSEWLQRAPVRDFVGDTILGSRARQRGLFDVDRLGSLLSGESRFGRNVWGVLCLELWMQQYLDGD